MAMPTVAPAAATDSAALSEAPPATTPDTVTIPKSVLGDKQCKPGERLTFVVRDVDPDTGDVEVELAGYGSEDQGGESMGDEMSRYPMET